MEPVRAGSHYHGGKARVRAGDLIFRYGAVIGLLLCSHLTIAESPRRWNDSRIELADKGQTETPPDYCMSDTVAPVEALAEALHANDREEARKLMDAGAPLPGDVTNWYQAIKDTFAEAIQQADLGFLTAAIAAGWDPNQAIHGRDWPLHLAISADQPDVVRLLIEKGADPNLPNVELRRPLAFADAEGRTEIAAMLIALGARYQEEDLWRIKERFLDAASSGDLDQISRFLKAGVVLDLCDHQGRTALFYAVEADRLDVTKALLRAGANPSRRDKNGHVPLALAVHYASTNVLERLLAAGADPDGEVEGSLQWTDYFGRKRESTTPLMLAVEEGDVDAMKALIAGGAHVNRGGALGQTALHYAVDAAQTAAERAPQDSGVSYDFPAVVKLLLDAGADPEIQDTRGRDALQDAMRWNRPDLFRTMAAGRDLAWFANWCAERLSMPTHTREIEFCAKAGAAARSEEFRRIALLAGVGIWDISTIRTLGESGVNLNATDEWGQTALIQAAKWNPSVVPYLLSLDLKVDATDNFGRTALMEAAKEHPALIPDLLRADANINARDSHGHSVLRYLLEHLSASPHHQYDPKDSDQLRFLLANDSFRPPESDLQALWLWAAEYGDLTLMRDLDRRQTDRDPLLDALSMPVARIPHALFVALEQSHQEAFTFLLERGARLSREEAERTVPQLVQTIEEQNWDQALALLEAGTKADGFGPDGLTPLIAVSRTDRLELLNQLLRAGVRIDRTSRDGRGTTALIEAIDNKRLDVVKRLIEVGADVDLPASNELLQPPLMRAARRGSLQLVELLLDTGADPLQVDANGHTVLDALPSDVEPNLRALLKQAIADASSTPPVLVWDWEGFHFTTLMDGAALSHDGRLLLVNSGQSLRVLDAATGLLIRKLEQPDDTATPTYANFRFIRDGKAVLATGPKWLAVWSVETGQLVLGNPLVHRDPTLYYYPAASIDIPGTDTVLSLVVEKEKRTDITRDGPNLVRWNAASGRTLSMQKVEQLGDLAVSGDGTKLAMVADDGKVWVWDLRKQELEARPVGRFPSGATLMVPNYDGLLAAPNGGVFAVSSDDGAVELWDTYSRKRLYRFEPDSDKSFSLLFAKFSSDGRRFYLNGRVWARETEEFTDNYLTPEGYRLDSGPVAFSLDGAMLAADLSLAGGMVGIWDISGGAPVRTLSFDGVGELRALAFSNDGRVLALAGDRALVIDAVSGETLWTTPFKQVVAASFTADGKTLVTEHTDHTLNLWNRSTGALLGSISGQGLRSVGGALFFERSGELLRLSSSTGSSESAKRELSAWSDWALLDTGGSAVALSDRGIVFLKSNGDIDGEPISPQPVDRDGGKICCAAMSFSGDLVAFGPPDRGAAVMDTRTAQVIFRLPGEYRHVTGLGFDREDQLRVARGNGEIETWKPRESASARAERPFDQVKGDAATGTNAAFAHDGQHVFLFNPQRGKAYYRNLITGERIPFDERAPSMSAALLSSESHRLLRAAGNTIEDFDLESGTLRDKLKGTREYVALAADPQRVWIAARDASGVDLWHLSDARVHHRFPFGVSPRFTRDGRFLVVWIADGNLDLVGDDEAAEQRSAKGDPVVAEETHRALVWDLARGQVLGEYPALVTLPNAEHLPIGPASMLSRIDGDDSLVLWEPESGKIVRHFDGAMRALSTYPGLDDRFVAARQGTAVVLSTSTAKTILTFDEHEYYNDGSTDDHHVIAAAVSADGRWLATGDAGKRVLVRDLSSGEVTKRFRAETGFDLNLLSFTQNNRFLVTATKYGAVRFWNLELGRLAATLIGFNDGSWALVDPKGRYDSNHPGNLPALSWVFPDEPSRAYPLAVFMQAYYEPGLLGRVLGGSSPPPAPELASLNRAQPLVKILSVSPSPGQPDWVDVVVEASPSEIRYRKNGKPRTDRAEIHDLRLFRNGRLIRTAPDQGGRLELDGSGRRRIVFEQVPLPNRHAGTDVVFTAYAFNQDRVKSETATRVYRGTVNESPRRPRAYVIAIGVNSHENASWNLEYAANDAQAIVDELSQALASTGRYAADDIVVVPLIADLEGPTKTKPLATKPLIKAVIDRLAGKPVMPELVSQLPEQARERLTPAHPDDLVILTFAGHGLLARDGRFHFFTYDIGPGDHRFVDERLLQGTLSSETLARWLVDVDADYMLMVIDACNSAASVNEAGFRPGPMGSRGLGQLAYDKAMLVLAASQAEQVALEIPSLRHGLLTYALVDEGLGAFSADHRPQDGHIDALEWLRFGEKRVPEVYATIGSSLRGTATENPKGLLRNAIPVTEGSVTDVSASILRVQRPHLFAFTHDADDAPILWQARQAPAQAAPQEPLTTSSP